MTGLDQREEGPEPSAPIVRPPAFAAPWMVGSLALVVGAVVDTVAFHHPLGLGMALGLAVAIVAVAAARTLVDAPRSPATPRLAAAALLLSLFVGVRSSPVLAFLNIGAVVLLMAIISQVRADGLGGWTLARYLRQPLAMGGDLVGGAVGFIAGDLAQAVPQERRHALRAIGSGMILSAPVIVVFAVLFASADATFDAYVRRAFAPASTEEAMWHLLGAGAVALGVAALWRTARRPRLRRRRPSHNGPPRLDPRSASTVLALLVFLFSLFVLTQVLGHNPDLVTPLDYKQNARGGFFQLLAVAFLVLTVLLVLDWLTRSDDGHRSPGLDRLAVALVVLTGAVMVSAMVRMWLYVDERGLTELRLYTSVFMVWLGFVLAWFLATVLRNLHARFALGLLASGLTAILLLNLVNPDALIVRFNWDRHLAGSGFGEQYNSILSADSIPSLVWVLENSPGERFCFVEARLAWERARMPHDRAADGILADSWSEFSARRALAGIDMALLDGC